jgi:hypothetical protein
MFSQQSPRFVFALSTLFLFDALTFGHQTEPQAATGRLVEVKIPAPSLKGNLLGDPTEQPLTFYLPPSYNTASTRRYPVVYHLHGFTCAPRKCHPRASGRNFTRSMSSTSTRLSSIRTIALLIL